MDRLIRIRRGKAKAKRGGGKGGKGSGSGKGVAKVGPYLLSQLAEVDKESLHEPDASKIDDDLLVVLEYDNAANGKFEGLSQALVDKSFKVGSYEHMKRFKRILDLQQPFEEEEYNNHRYDDQFYHCEVVLTDAGYVAMASFGD